MSFHPVAKALIVVGGVLVLAGLLWQFGSKVLPLGRLPGDIAIERGNFRFYFPVATSILVSLLLTLVGWLLGKLGR